MSRIESADKIEGTVGAKRHSTLHVARAVSAKQRVYVLHSRECIERITERSSDIRLCPFSVALDEGIDLGPWEDFLDVAVEVEIDEECGDLVPTRTHEPADPSPVRCTHEGGEWPGLDRCADCGQMLDPGDPS